MPSERKWYYDACTLDVKDTYVNILNNKRKHNISTVIGHLSLGEASGNCFRKGSERYKLFLELINDILELDYVEIVGHDDINNQLNCVRIKLDFLTLTDSIHLATALRQNCETFVTADPDFNGITKRELKEIATECGQGNISIDMIEIEYS